LFHLVEASSDPFECGGEYQKLEILAIWIEFRKDNGHEDRKGFVIRRLCGDGILKENLESDGGEIKIARSSGGCTQDMGEVFANIRELEDDRGTALLEELQLILDAGSITDFIQSSSFENGNFPENLALSGISVLVRLAEFKKIIKSLSQVRHADRINGRRRLIFRRDFLTCL
jgi:hypothetical protein